MDRVDLEKAVLVLAPRLESPGDLLDEKDLDRGLNLLDGANSYLKKSVDEDGCASKPDASIAVLGTSGAGKSTLVSFLFGKGKMTVLHSTPFTRELGAEQPSAGIAIRSGSVSSTLLPVCCRVVVNGQSLAVWDMPGSQDTRGPFVQLLIHKIFQWMTEESDKKALRFVLVSPPLHERPQAAALETMINSPLITEDSAVIVYTKCSAEFDPRSTAQLDLVESKRSIRSFALPEPKRGDRKGHDYSSQYGQLKQEILEALTSLHSSTAAYSNPLPPSAQLLLNKLRECCVTFAREALSTCFLKQFDVSCRRTLSEMVNTLAHLKMTDPISLESAVGILARLVPSTGDPVRTNESVSHASRRLAQMDSFPGQTRLRLTEWLNKDGISLLEKVKGDLAILIEQVSSYNQRKKTSTRRSDGGTTKMLVISAIHLHLSHEKERIVQFVKSHHRPKSLDDIPAIFLVGFSSVTVDANLQMWANVAIVSDSVRVTLDQPFELSAVGRAQTLDPTNLVAGTDGKHGLPGLPGGNLMVVCNHLNGDKQKLFSTRSCGQHGGNAQDGGDGINGRDSQYKRKDFERDLKSAIKKGALLTEKQASSPDLPGGIQADECTYKDETSETSSIFWGAPGRRECSFERESTGGGAGTRPGSGGRGGAGGKGGRVRILQMGAYVLDGKSVSGEKGGDGRQGRAAKDGRISPKFAASVKQWYYTGGWFGRWTENPKTEIVEISPPERSVLEAQPTTKIGPAPIPNTSLTILDVMANYEFVRTQLEIKFPQCDFSPLDIKWTAT